MPDGLDRQRDVKIGSFDLKKGFLDYPSPFSIPISLGCVIGPSYKSEFWVLPEVTLALRMSRRDGDILVPCFSSVLHTSRSDARVFQVP